MRCVCARADAAPFGCAQMTVRGCNGAAPRAAQLIRSSRQQYGGGEGSPLARTPARGPAHAAEGGPGPAAPEPAARSGAARVQRSPASPAAAAAAPSGGGGLHRSACAVSAAARARGGGGRPAIAAPASDAASAAATGSPGSPRARPFLVRSRGVRGADALQPHTGTSPPVRKGPAAGVLKELRSPVGGSHRGAAPAGPQRVEAERAFGT